MEVPESFLSYVLEKEFVTVEGASQDLDLKEVTVRNYLSRMKRDGLIERVGRGRYVMMERDRVPPHIPDGLKSVLDLIEDSYPDLGPVVWSVSMISDYMHNVPGGDLYSIDISRDIAIQLKTFLGDRGVLVFMDPDPISIEDYSWSNLEPIFLFRRGEQFASIPMNGHRIAMVDRIWVDIYYLCTRKSLPFPLIELGVVLRNLITSGSISIDRLLKYSSRRGLRAEMMLILYELGKVDPNLHLLERILPHSPKAEEWINEVVIGGLEGW